MTQRLEPLAHGTHAEIRPWVWSQHWLDVLFLHWPVPTDALRSQLPAALEIDTYDGQAWVSLVLFRLRVRPRWLPFLPGLSNLVEVNLRTYVRHRDEPGIWFLSAHADNGWAIRLAKQLTPMPYVQAEMCYRRRGEALEFRAACASPPAAKLALKFSPLIDQETSIEGTLDSWLLERYRLYIQDRTRRLLQADVVHDPWVTQDVEVSVSENNLGELVGLDLSGAPARVHFSAGVQARFGGFCQGSSGIAS